MDDPRTKAFTIRLLIYWFVSPLIFGAALLLWGAYAPPVEVSGPDWMMPAAYGGVGVLVGSFIALVQTVVTYRRLYLRGPK